MGHHVQENLGDLEVVEKFTFFQKLAYVKRPNGPSGMRAFFQPPPNHLNFGTHDLLHKQCLVSNFFYFFEFIMPSRLTAENIGLCLKGALSNDFFQKFLS